MLILSRKNGSKTILEVAGRTIVIHHGPRNRVGYEAPRDVRIIRGEAKDKKVA